MAHPSRDLWVPVRDLLEVYHRMGSDQYTEQEIIEGNTAIFFAGYGERLISARSLSLSALVQNAMDSCQLLRLGRLAASKWMSSRLPITKWRYGAI